MPDYFEFEVELAGVKPRIWRRFLVPKTATFLDLHQAIQDACGWWDYHLFNFFARNPYGESVAGIPDDTGMTEHEVPDASRRKLSSFFGMGKGAGKGKKKSCGYLYDFGDDWLHKVKLRGETKLKEKPPRVLLAGERAFPHEDCGGMGGYERCAKFVLTGEDEWDDAEGFTEWLDGWHPDEFDFEAVKKRFDLGRGAPGGFGPDEGDDLAAPVTGLPAAADLSPEERNKVMVFVAASARGSNEPWTSVFECSPSFGRNKNCRGRIMLWLQEVPYGAGWRCSACGAEGLVTELTGMPLTPDMLGPHDPSGPTVSISMSMDEYSALTECHALDLAVEDIVIAAAYEDGNAVIEAPETKLDILLDAGFIVTNLRSRPKSVVKFYNKRGTAEQWIKEGKHAINWTRLSCHDFKDNEVRLQLFALAYNLGNFLRRLALPRNVKHWSMTTLRDKLIKIGAKVVHHAGYVVFQMAEVAVPRELFGKILERIGRLRLEFG